MADNQIFRASARWLMAAIIGVAVAGVEASNATDGDWLVSPDTIRAEAPSLLARSGSVEAGPSAPLAREAGADSYDPYTCAAAYGDTFCAEFERCMSAYGFGACYARFNR